MYHTISKSKTENQDQEKNSLNWEVLTYIKHINIVKSWFY